MCTPVDASVHWPLCKSYELYIFFPVAFSKVIEVKSESSIGRDVCPNEKRIPNIYGKLLAAHTVVHTLYIFIYCLIFKIIRFPLPFISVTYITDKPWRSGTNTAIS